MSAPSLKFTILGCGGSTGVPAICNHWGNCDPAEQRNRRSRPSAAIQSATTTLVIDTGPDFKDQVNRAELDHIDAVLYTHAHGDHIHGLDDLRVLRNRAKALIPVYGNRAAIAELLERFSYMFQERNNGLYPQVLQSSILEPEQFCRPMTIGDITFTPFEQDHGTCVSLGFRFGNLAYSTDMVDLDDRAIAALQGVKTWIVDAAGYKMPENKVHATLNQVYALNKKVKAEQVYLTHLSYVMDYNTLVRELPAGYAPAYDGLTIAV